MNIIFTSKAWDDYQYWLETDKRQLRRINKLIKETLRSPFEGLGKPEPLKARLRGAWSRRIDGEHRLVYQVKDTELYIISCRYHYE